jgi:cyclohexanecarboxylate-CoA ligase
MASTLGHQTGFLYGVRLPLLLGATAVYQERWDPDMFLRLVDEEHITLTLGATPFLADTLRACRSSGRRVHSLRSSVAVRQFRNHSRMRSSRTLPVDSCRAGG